MRIAVEVKPDFIEKVARRTDPVGAVEELVWNGLDADATEIDVDLEVNDLGGVVAVVIRNNGHGIPGASAASAFSGMGGSWKRDAQGTDSGRQLHGRHGYGRFRVLALGSSARWITVAESPEGRCATGITFSDGSSSFNSTTWADARSRPGRRSASPARRSARAGWPSTPRGSNSPPVSPCISASTQTLCFVGVGCLWIRAMPYGIRPSTFWTSRSTRVRLRFCVWSSGRSRASASCWCATRSACTV